MRKTVSFVSISDVLTHMQLDVDAQANVFDYGFRHVSFGDAEHTLIDNNFALSCILDSMYEDADCDLFAARFWEIVGEDDLIDLEN